jgi:hypothetical protein
MGSISVSVDWPMDDLRAICRFGNGSPYFASNCRPYLLTHTTRQIGYVRHPLDDNVRFALFEGPVWSPRVQEHRRGRFLVCERCFEDPQIAFLYLTTLPSDVL